MGFGYRIVVEWSEDDAVYVARVPALPGCAAHGDTEAAAVAEARVAAEGIIETMRELGRPIPPSDVAADYSGKVLLRLPRSLHAELAKRADVEGVSLNQLLVALLAARGATKKKKKSAA